MDKFITVIIGILCGVAQFFVMRYTLKPLSKGEAPFTALFMLLKLPIPIALLVGIALVDVGLMPYGGIALCVGLFGSSVLNHLITTKKGDK